MLALSSTNDVIESIATAKEIAVEAYTLHGPVLRALEAVARRGAHVVVRLEGRPYDDARRHLSGENARIAAALRRAGADAGPADPIHAKRISVDGTLYLDEKNWQMGDIVLRDDDASEAASIPMTKDRALAEEARLLGGARRRDGVIVESESFGAANVTYSALRRLGRAGAAPRLLVSEADLRETPRERAVLTALVRDGVRVRVCRDSAKFAVAGDRAWLGSANATYAGGRWNMTDWGLRTGNAEIVTAVRIRLEAQWKAAIDFSRVPGA